MKSLKKDLNKLRGKNPKMRLDDEDDGDAPLASGQYASDSSPGYGLSYDQTSFGQPMGSPVDARKPSFQRKKSPPQYGGGSGEAYAGAYGGGGGGAAGYGNAPSPAGGGFGNAEGPDDRRRREDEQREQEDLELAMATSASMAADEAAARRTRPPPAASGEADEEEQMRRALELSRLDAEPDLMGGDPPAAAPAARDFLSEPAPAPAPTNPLSDLDALFAAPAPAPARSAPQTGQGYGQQVGGRIPRSTCILDMLRANKNNNMSTTTRLSPIYGRCVDCFDLLALSSQHIRTTQAEHEEPRAGY